MFSFRLLTICIVFVICCVIPSVITLNYEESLADMLTQCFEYQEKIFDGSRQPHECEKENFNGNFSYTIQSMTSRNSKQKFHCFHFLKSPSTHLKFKIWFSHKNIKIDGYGIRNYKRGGDKFESKIFAEKTSLVVTGVKGFPFPEIFGFELNGVDKCPLCGKKPENLISRISDDEFEVFDWPWHVAIYQKASGSLSYKCSGALISSTAVLTSGNCNVTLFVQVKLPFEIESLPSIHFQHHASPPKWDERSSSKITCKLHLVKTR